MSLSYIIGQRFAFIRKQARITRAKLCENGEISTTTLFNIETGRSHVTIDILYLLLQMLQMRCNLSITLEEIVKVENNIFDQLIAANKGSSDSVKELEKPAPASLPKKLSS